MKAKNYSVFPALPMLMWEKRNSFSFSSSVVKISCLYHLLDFVFNLLYYEFKNIQMPILSSCMKWRPTSIISWIFVFNLLYYKFTNIQMPILSRCMNCLNWTFFENNLPRLSNFMKFFNFCLDFSNIQCFLIVNIGLPFLSYKSTFCNTFVIEFVKNIFR